jgi:choline monooxygenase
MVQRYGATVAHVTLPASWYSDPERFGRERQRVFGTEWLFAGFAASLREPGDHLATDIAGWSILVVVDDDGHLRGHHNVCRHRAGPLVDPGVGHSPSLVCRYHGWAYGLDGQLRSARDFEGDASSGFSCDGIALAPVRAEAWRGLVFVHLELDGPAVGLVDALGSFAAECDEFALESFVPTQDAEHRIACNWKTYADNYLEGYHIPLVHPGLNKEIDAKRYQVDVSKAHRWVRHTAPTRAGAVNAGRWLWRWPNLAINVYPGGMNVERYDPVGVDQTRLRYSYAFVDPGDPENEDVVRVSAQVTAEDVAICEAVQRNLDSGAYDTGWLSPRHEGGVEAFQRWIAEALS